MSTVPRHLEFAPPPTPGMLRAMGLAILAHLVLLAILAAGVQWKRDAVPQTVEAELWSALPVEAAPPAPLPEPVVQPAPEPKPVPKPEPVTPPPDTTKLEADIALQKEKAKQLKALALEKAELEKKKLAELEKKKQAELDKKKQAELDKLKQAKLDQAKLEQDHKAEKLKKEQADKLAHADQQRKQDAKEAQQVDTQRKDAVRRAMGLAGAGGNGSPASTGTAAQSSGPSASYLGRLAARVKPNIVFTESVNGNPAVEVDVRTSPSGNILSARVTKSSGIKAWDDAVLRAIDKTEVLPRDTDGSIPSLIPFAFRPKD